jgi:hypothetical protein
MKQLIFFILIITSLSLNAQGVKIQPKNCTTPTVDTDIKLLFSVVNDSIRIDSFDNKLGTIVGSPQFIDDAINKTTAKFTRTNIAPTDTLANWIDSSSNIAGVELVKEYKNGLWIKTAYYDKIGNVFSNQPPLFVLSSGQSNATSRDGGGDNSTNPYVTDFDYNSETWQIASPGNNIYKPQNYCYPCNNYVTNFGKSAAVQDNRIVKIVSWSYGNQQISQWADPPPSFAGDSLLLVMNLTNIPKFDIFLWFQGESDYLIPPNSYHPLFYSLLDRLESTGKFSRKNTKVLIAEIPGIHNEMNTSFNFMANDTVANITVVPTRDLGTIDDDHLSGLGQQLLGERFYSTFRDGFKTNTGIWSYTDEYKAFNTNKYAVGIGTNTPTSGVKLDIWGKEVMFGSDISTSNSLINTRLNADLKTATLSMPNYLSSDNRFSLFYASASAATKNVVFGGGLSSHHPATNLEFWTGSNGTVGGTNKMDIDANGYVYIWNRLGIGTYSGSEKLTVNGNAELRGTSPYLTLAGTTTTYVQANVTPNGAGVGNYTTIVVPASQGVSLETGGTVGLVVNPTSANVSIRKNVANNTLDIGTPVVSGTVGIRVEYLNIPLLGTNANGDIAPSNLGGLPTFTAATSDAANTAATVGIGELFWWKPATGLGKILMSKE